MPSLGWEDHLRWFHNEQALQPPPCPFKQPRACLELTRMSSSGNPGLLGLSWRRDLRSCLACFSVRMGEAPEKVRKDLGGLSGTPIHVPSRCPRPSTPSAAHSHFCLSPSPLGFGAPLVSLPYCLGDFLSTPQWPDRHFEVGERRS